MRYTSEFVQQITALLSTGEHTYASVCQRLGLSRQTFFRWLREKRDFRDAVKGAKQMAVENLASEGIVSLRQLVCGFWSTETTTSATQGGAVIIKQTRWFVPPNVTAVMYALNNGDPDNFRHVAHMNMKHSGDHDNPVQTYLLQLPDDGRNPHLLPAVDMPLLP